MVPGAVGLVQGAGTVSVPRLASGQRHRQGREADPGRHARRGAPRMTTVAEFEARVEAFFRQHAEPADEPGWGVGDDSVMSAELSKDEPGPDEIEQARVFQQLL